MPNTDARNNYPHRYNLIEFKTSLFKFGESYGNSIGYCIFSCGICYRQKRTRLPPLRVITQIHTHKQFVLDEKTHMLCVFLF